METKNELDDLLKLAMRFDNGELPEPDPNIQIRLRKKLTPNKKSTPNRFLSRLLDFLNMDIKLYHAGIGIAVVLIFFALLRNGCESSAENRHQVMVADTNVDMNQKNDSFLVKNFKMGIY